MFVRVQVPPAVLFRREDREIEDAGRRPFLFGGGRCDVCVCHGLAKVGVAGSSPGRCISNLCFFCPYRANLNLRSFSQGGALG